MVGFIKPDLEPRVPVFSGLAKKSVFRNRDIFRIRIELFFPESGSGSAENPDPIRKNPDPEPWKKIPKTVSKSRKLVYFIFSTLNTVLFVRFLQNSVVNPNTLNLDPDPGFLPNLDPDPGLYNQFWKKTFKIILERIFFCYETSIFFLNYKNKLSPKEMFNQLGLWIVN